MGRHAGWIALHAGIAGGADVVLIPEIDWDFEHVCRKVLERESEGKRFTLVVVAEGANLPEQGLVTSGSNGEKQQVRLGGIGVTVAAELGRRLQREVRTVILGHLQRGGTPSALDRTFATWLGTRCAELIERGQSCVMLGLRGSKLVAVPLKNVAGATRLVPTNHPLVVSARLVGTSFGD
jgi:6-phosphofructokinase 1